MCKKCKLNSLFKNYTYPSPNKAIRTLKSDPSDKINIDVANKKSDPRDKLKIDMANKNRDSGDILKINSLR